MLQCQITTSIVCVEEKHWPKTGTTHFYDDNNHFISIIEFPLVSNFSRTISFYATKRPTKSFKTKNYLKDYFIKQLFIKQVYILVLTINMI